MFDKASNVMILSQKNFKIRPICGFRILG